MNDFIPNFTQIPNVIFDNLMSELSDAELRVLLYICRRTYGFHKKIDKISFSQFENGLEGKDTGCGLRKEAISKGISGLEDKGIIIIEKSSSGNTYSINELFGYRTDSSSVIEPQVVRLPNIQNKEEIKEKKIYTKSKEFLINIPESDLLELSQKYNATASQIVTKGDQLYNWLLSKGKVYKDYKALLRNAISSDYGLRETKKSAMYI